MSEFFHPKLQAVNVPAQHRFGVGAWRIAISLTGEISIETNELAIYSYILQK